MVLRRAVLLLALSTSTLTPVFGQGPGPSIVHVVGHQLMVQKRNPDGSLSPSQPYTIRGVVWSPASKDTNTSPSDPNNATVRRPEFAKWAVTDVPLMAGMNANTVRLFIDPGFDATLGPAGLQTLDALYARGIMVIMTVDDAINSTSRITSAVSYYKNHPAILMWMLGNEWNINRYYGVASSVSDAAQRTETAAALIKSLDTNHPVSTSYGDIDIDSNGLRLADTQHYVNDVVPSVDIWGLNIYRGSSFGTLFAQWASISTKPMFLGEFGTDAFFSSCARSNSPNGALDERTQEEWDLALWNEIAANLSAADSSNVTLGSVVFELSDEWWKVGPPGAQQTSGFLLVNGHPDDFANEEYFGVADIDRNPRAVYYGLRRAFAAGSPGISLPHSRVDFFTLPASLTTNVPAFLVAGTVQSNSRAFINGTEITVDSGGTFVSRYPLASAQNLAVGANSIALRVLGPDGSERITTRTVDYEPGFSTQNARLLYVDSVAPSVPGTIVIDLDASVILGLLDQQHVRGISPDGSVVYMDSRAVISTSSHASTAGGPLPFSLNFAANGFLVSPLGDFLYAGNEIVDRSSNTLSSSHLPVSIVTGIALNGGPIPGGPAITPDGQVIYCGTSNSSITKIDRIGLTSSVVSIPFEEAFFSDLAVSPDGTILGRANYGGGNFIVSFYDAGTLSRLASVNVPGDYSGELVFSSTGQCAVVGSSGNPVFQGGGVTALTLPGYQQRACSLIDAASNLTISGGNELYVSSGTRFGVDVMDFQPCEVLRRSRNYFLGINQFVVGQGPSNEIRRLVLRDLPALSVKVSGTGGGTVTSLPAGITCGADCQEGFAPGTGVTLTATPDPDSVFAGWSGDPDCSDGVVTMSSAKTCVATFNLQVLTLTVNRTGNGSGTVTSAPAGITCGADCTESYLYGTPVTLSAVSAPGSLFTGWTGNPDCADGVVTMQSAKTCVAGFATQTQALTVSRSGSGSGTVTSSPPGITCGADCTEGYAYGTQVTLTATPGVGSVFTGWSGDPDCADGVVVLNSGRSCVAEFRPNFIFGNGFESGDTSAWQTPP